jgi:hypothetical protein
MKGTLRNIDPPPLDQLAEKDGLVWNCKLCHRFSTYYTVYGMTESKGPRDMLEHWKEKHEVELSVIVGAKRSQVKE